MTFKEKMKAFDSRRVDRRFFGGVCGCPCGYGWEKDTDAPCRMCDEETVSWQDCEECWNREMPDGQGETGSDSRERIKK